MNSIVKYSTIVLLSAFIAACGGGGSSSPDQGSTPAPVVATKATVGIILTDASIEDYDHAYVTISSVALLGNGDQQMIFSGEERVDLLALRDNVELFAVSENVDPGEYSKIRMQASNMELVVDNADGSTTSTPVNLVANGKIDLNPRGNFTLAAGDVVFASLDWDMHESLKLTETGNGNGNRKINMRPVIFVDIGTAPAFKQGLVRVFGYVDLIAPDFSAFRLCSPDVMTHSASSPILGELCLDIVSDQETGVFGADGNPIGVTDLSKDDPVTVIGLLQRSVDAPGVTPLQDEAGDVRPTTFQILAIVVEGGDKGTWSRTRGSVKSAVVAGTDPGTNVFDFLVHKAPDAAEDTLLTGKLFEKSRVFSLSRDDGLSEIPATDLMIDDRVAVDSVQIPSGDATVADTLNIAIMLSHTPVDPDLAHIGGEILSVDAVNGTMMVASASGDVCVTTDDDTKIFQVFVSEDAVESKPATLGELSAGSKVALSGVMDACFAARLIIAEGQAAVTQ